MHTINIYVCVISKHVEVLSRNRESKRADECIIEILYSEMLKIRISYSIIVSILCDNASRSSLVVAFTILRKQNATNDVELSLKRDSLQQNTREFLYNPGKT